MERKDPNEVISRILYFVMTLILCVGWALSVLQMEKYITLNQRLRKQLDSDTLYLYKGGKTKVMSLDGWKLLIKE